MFDTYIDFIEEIIHAATSQDLEKTIEKIKDFDVSTDKLTKHEQDILLNYAEGKLLLMENLKSLTEVLA